MKTFLARGITAQFLLAVAALFSLAFIVSAQTKKREHLTAQEIELVRDAQELDKRTEIFVKAIDRRFQVLGAAGMVADAKKAKKDKSDWGAQPTGSRVELLGDIAGILEEAMNNIDNIYSRDEKNALIPKSLKILSAAAEHFSVQLKRFSQMASEEKEREAVYQISREVEQIIQANAEFSQPNGK